MKKILLIAIIGILCLSMFSAVTPNARAPASETPLQVAEKAAVWTFSQAIYESGGYKWAWYDLRNTLSVPYYASSVQYGSAGFGTFYLKLYNKTGDPTYLDYAKGAAQWILSQAVPDSGGYKWPHPDADISNPGWWLSPIVSGIGDFLLSMYQTTGNTTYLSYATGAAKWLMAMAYWGEPGCFIPYNPPNPYGTQALHGIGPGREAYTMTFLLHMYEETGDSVYLPYVEGMATWLISGPDKATDPNGYKWRFNRPFGSVYPLDGNGQIALFFYEIYEALGNTTYLQYAQGAMNWILKQAVLSGDMAKWFDPVYGYYRTLPFSGSGGFEGFWGVPEPNDLLTAVYQITGNATYLDYAKKLANWIISPAIAVPEGGGYKFTDFEGPSFYSAIQNAKIYNFLSWLYDATGETSYRNYADGALQWIISNATATGGGYAWRSIDRLGYVWSTIANFPYDTTWFDSGAAGVGYYLITALPISPTSQCTLTVNSAYGSPTPTTGTYSPGTSITASVTSPETGPTGTQYVCTGWSGTGDVPASGTGTSVTFTITQDSSITWNWKTQYYLTVTSPYGTTSGAGWYDSGQIAAFSTSPIKITVTGTMLQHVFATWSSSDPHGYAGSASSDSVTMNNPITETASWTLQNNFSVGGEWVPITMQSLSPINAVQLLAPWIVLALIAAATAVAAYRRFLKKRW